MWPVIVALVAGTLAAVKAAGSKKEPELGPDGKPKVKKTEAELFAEGERAGRAKAEAEAATKRAEEKKIRAAVRREMGASKARRVAELDDDDDDDAPATKPPGQQAAH